VELVAKVVEKILELANKPLPLDVGEHVVGVKEVAQKLIHCGLFEKGVSALGLWGMGGIGKSTLAKELYNQLCKIFEASCYVEDVIDKIMQGHGVVEIQKRLLKDLCSSVIDNDNKSQLKPILEKRLSKKRIVVVLDDVSNVEMLNYIMTFKMLRKGSVCIVTSRDKHVFEASNIFDPNKQKVYVHEVQMLNMEDSKRVFSSFAFGGEFEMRPKFEELATNISKLCSGVPLVLRVCGALLKGEGNLDVWEDVKSKLKFGAILDDKDILKCLRISYDSLEEKDKEMFLDIACALLGQSENMAICIWRSQEWQPSLGIRNLKNKTLISVDEEGRFTMHDHLRDMGREIERVEAGDSRRRLWMPKSLSILEERKVHIFQCIRLMIHM
jgi:hypothetical protein